MPKIKQLDWSKLQPKQNHRKKTSPNNNFWKKVKSKAVDKSLLREDFDRTEIIKKLSQE